MIHIQNLHFSYRKQKVFDGLSLTFSPGHIYGLLGKNGTGKSTLLKNMAGLVFPKSGHLEVNGYVPAHRRPGFLQDIFMVPEEFYLPNISLQEFIKYEAPFYPRFSQGQFEKCIQAFEVPLGSTLQNMSYGQKKKVLISFALATNARLLLMDEPTNGLDIMSKSQFRRVLAQSLDEERCLIISTHQVKDLENLIDRVTIIDEGKILFDATVEEITSKLAFRLSFDAEAAEGALYSESSLKGHIMITPNYDADESKLDLELLYKAVVTNGEKIKTLFQS